MILMQGKGVSKGVVKGPLYFFRRQDTTVVKTTVNDQSAEQARLQQAQEKALWETVTRPDGSSYIVSRERH